MVESAGFRIVGHDLGYPTHFRDGSSLMGLFSVPTAAANDLLGDRPFTAAQIAPGRSIMTLVCVHYTDTDCGSYDEVAFALFVEPRPRPHDIPYLSTAWRALRGTVPSYSWRLAVTTELSRQAGLEMWGFPKTLEDLRWSRRDGRASMSWYDGDTEVLSLEVPATGTTTPRTISPPVYSVLDGEPMVGHLTQSYRGVGYHRRGVSLRLGEHPVADEIRRLRPAERPLLATWSEHLHFTMSAPRTL